MPNAPAFSCDICGQLQYDASFLTVIELLLQEMEAGLTPEKAAPPIIKTEQPTQWHPTRSR